MNEDMSVEGFSLHSSDVFHPFKSTPTTVSRETKSSSVTFTGNFTHLYIFMANDPGLTTCGCSSRTWQTHPVCVCKRE